MPYRALTLRSISGESLRSLLNGLPGAARIMKKARVTTRNRVGTITSRRRRRKRSIRGFRAASTLDDGPVAKLPPRSDVVNETNPLEG